MFNQGGIIDHCTHVTGPLAQYSDESEYNVACNVVIAIAHFRMLNNELLKKCSDVVPEEAHHIILDRKSAIFMANNGKDTKHTRHISRRMHLVSNGEELNFHKTLWYEGGVLLI